MTEFAAVPPNTLFIRTFGTLLLCAMFVPVALSAAEIDTTDLSDGTATARAEFLPNEGSAQAFDNDAATKWLDPLTNGASPDGNPANYSYIDFIYSGTQTRACFKYTITSANDVPGRDPADWAIYGIDALGNRTLLDTQTNQVFTNRFEKKTYAFANTTRYRGYRLEIQRIAVPGNGLQVSEVEYIDSITDTTDPQTGTVTARGENPPNEIATKLFDNSSATKWLDHIAPNGTLANYTFVQYLFPGTETHAINRYALTSANDLPGRDPRDWVLYGVDAAGGFTQLDSRTNQTFATRFLRQGYSFINSTPYRGYRLEIRHVNDPGVGQTQLAELEFIADVAANPVIAPAAGTYAAPQNITLSTITAGASIRYTTDGSNPTPTTGTLYTAPFALNASATVKAIAYKTPLENSAVISAAYTLVPVPTVLSVSPSVGPTPGGQTITITGTNFVAGQTQVTLGGTLCTAVNVISLTSLTCITPAHAAGAVTATVTVSSVATGSLNNAYTYLNAPAISAVSPGATLLAGGNSVTISGTNFPPFTNLVSVTLAGIPAAVNTVAADGSSITVTAGPSANAQSGPVIVTAYGSQSVSSATPFTYFAAASITSFTPPGGSLQGGVPVTLTGANFPLQLSAYSITLAGIPATVTAVSPDGTTLTAIPGSATAPVQGPISVTLYGVQTVSTAAAYFYDFAPLFSEAPHITPNPAVAGANVIGSSALVGVGTIQWNWGDGSPLETGASVQHIYANAGMYTVTILATGSNGLTTVQTLSMFVSFGVEGGGDSGGGASPGGVTGIQVGGGGISAAQGGSGKIVCNYVRRSSTTYTGSIGNLKLPADMTQESLLGLSGTFVLGTGDKAQTFVFTLKRNGKGKATGLPLIEFSIAKKYFQFKAKRAELAELTEALGGPRQLGINKGEKVTLQVPATLQLGPQIFLALTFIVDYQQISGGRGKGNLK